MDNNLLDFQDWLLKIYSPTLLVYSTNISKKIISKNNLSPAEFIRPFANFSGNTISFSFSDKFSINIRNFRLDTFDSEKFKKRREDNLDNTNSSIKKELENLLCCNEPVFNEDNTPFLLSSSLNNNNNSTINKIKDCFNKSSCNNMINNNINLNSKYANSLKIKHDMFVKSLGKHFNNKWYSEYEYTYFESLFFNEFEMYQQPFGYIFICSINDSLDDIKLLKKRDNIPILLSEGVYEIMMPTMVIILYDKSEQIFSEQEMLKKIDQIKNDNQRFYVYFLEINMNISEDSQSTLNTTNDYNNTTSKKINYNKDIWSKYIHKSDYYSNISYYSKEKGLLISLEERENLKAGLLKFMNDYIKAYLQKQVYSLDSQISETKKGFRNNFISIFRKTDKIEYIHSLNIYKLTYIEKDMFKLSVIQFYFRNYEDAASNLLILAKDIKVSYL